MLSPTRSLPALALALALATLACGRPKPELEAEARKVEDPAELAEAPATSDERRRRSLRRGAGPMPETFAAFPRPDLSALDGVWIIDGHIPNRGVVWDVEDDGSVLTIIDRHGREELHGITLSSPCALRLTDENGRAHARSIALTDERLLVTSKGAIAVAAPDGSLLACAGHRTYQIAADGRCRYTTEMLGAWSDPVEAEDLCKLDKADGARVLIIGGQRLREHEGGLWFDDVAAADVAVRMDDRAAATAALAPTPATMPAAEAAAISETGQSEATGETG
ncbi:MAG TPA: hypothetical protein VM869_08575 [Enhygromyxa sp.]|nr:hypothetical protein [Enhygromyxa sp.]